MVAAVTTVFFREGINYALVPAMPDCDVGGWGTTLPHQGLPVNPQETEPSAEAGGRVGKLTFSFSVLFR